MYSYCHFNESEKEKLPNYKEVDNVKNPKIHHNDLKIGNMYFITIKDHNYKTPRTDYIHIGKFIDDKSRSNKNSLQFHLLETSNPNTMLKIWGINYRTLYVYKDVLEITNREEHKHYNKEYIFNEVNDELIELLKKCHKDVLVE